MKERVAILTYLEYIAEHDAYRDEHPWIENKKEAPKPVATYFPPRVLDKNSKPCNPANATGGYRRVKGTKRYRKEQRKKKKMERWAGIVRVNALIDELAAMRR